MKRNVLFGTILAAAMSVGVGAQSGMGSAQTPATGRTSQSVTVTGCLQSSTAPSATGTSGSTAGTGAASADNFILASANLGAGSRVPGAAPAGANPSSPAPSSTTAGTSGSAATASASQYKLVGGNKDDLRRYVNSQVEITGKVDAAASPAGGAMGGATAGSPAAGAATGSPAARASDAGPTLNVDSVRQVSPSCSAQ